MARASRTRRKSGGSKTARLPLLMGMAMVLTVVALAAFLVTRPSGKDCVATTILLVDMSDRLRASQLERLKNELRNIGTQSNSRITPYLSKGERLAIYFIGEDGAPPSSVFAGCSPGDVENRSVWESLTEGEIIARVEWLRFSEGLLAAFDDMVAQATGNDTSPILEALEYVRAKEFPPPGILDGTVDYRILIWSDMIQNSRTESHFEGLGDVQAIHDRLPVDLEHVQVTVFRIASEKYPQYQTGEHVAWWRQFFAYARANAQGWEKL